MVFTVCEICVYTAIAPVLCNYPDFFQTSALVLKAGLPHAGQTYALRPATTPFLVSSRDESAPEAPPAASHLFRQTGR